MNVYASNRGFGTPEPAPKKRFPTGWIVLTLVVVTTGVAFWYYFFGRKPKSVFTVPIASKNQQFGELHGLWPIENGDVLIFASGELKRVSVADRAVKWTAKVPAPAKVNRAWRDGMNTRFVRLQQWADTLTAKRAGLKTPEETKAFNEEADKYRVELTAARAEAGPREATVPAAEPVATGNTGSPMATKAKPEVAAVEAPVKLEPIASPEIQLLEQRIKRRKEQLSKIEATIATKKASAKTPIQVSAVADEERRRDGVVKEQNEDQKKLAELKGSAVKQAEEEEKAEEEEELHVAASWGTAVPPMAGVVGGNVWLAESERIVAFDAVNGALKSHLPLAGQILEAASTEGELHIVAAAGAEARQITRINATTGPISLYLPAAKVTEEMASFGEDSEKPDPAGARTVFSKRLLRADIRLKEKKVIAKDAIKPDAEKELTNAASNAIGGSTEEALAIAKLMEVDAQRTLGQSKEYVDQSTYEVALRRPFDASVPEWKGTVSGRVELISTPSYELMTAGTRLYAFDQSNRLIWEAAMGGPMPRLDADESAEICLESNGRLYFADGAFLTAFDAPTGKVVWRLPSIGIRKVQMDADGNLFVHSRNMPTQSLTYALGTDLSDENPILFMVDSASGKVQWEQEKYEEVFVSGTHVYALRIGRNPADLEEQVFNPGKAKVAPLKLYKLNRSTGRPIWEWYQAKRPSAVHAAERSIGFLFPDAFEVVHSISM